MIESPLIQELMDETVRKLLLIVLETRFGIIPAEMADALEKAQGDEQMRELTRLAATCPDLDSFRSDLASITSRKRRRRRAP